MEKKISRFILVLKVQCSKISNTTNKETNKNSQLRSHIIAVQIPVESTQGADGSGKRTCANLNFCFKEGGGEVWGLILFGGVYIYVGNIMKGVGRTPVPFSLSSRSSHLGVDGLQSWFFSLLFTFRQVYLFMQNIICEGLFKVKNITLD